MGHISYSASWETPIIDITMEGIDYQIMIIIYYESEDWEEKVNALVLRDF